VVRPTRPSIQVAPMPPDPPLLTLRVSTSARAGLNELLRGNCDGVGEVLVTTQSHLRNDVHSSHMGIQVIVKREYIYCSTLCFALAVPNHIENTDPLM
jgi:hypothetical protein